MVAVATVLVGLALFLGPSRSWIALLVSVVVAYTLWSGANQAIRYGKLGVWLPMVNADGWPGRCSRYRPGCSLAEAHRRYGEVSALPGRPAPVLAVVNSAGHLLGVVNDAALAGVPVDRRPWVSVDTVAAGLNRDRILPADPQGLELIQAVRSYPASEMVTLADHAGRVPGCRARRGAPIQGAFPVTVDTVAVRRGNCLLCDRVQWTDPKGRLTCWCWSPVGSTTRTAAGWRTTT